MMRSRTRNKSLYGANFTGQKANILAPQLASENRDQVLYV